MSSKSDAFKVQLLETFASLITAAFSLVAALAWNDAIQTLVNQFFEEGDEFWGQFVYALIVTILAVIMALLIGRSLANAKKAISTAKDDEPEEKKE